MSGLLYMANIGIRVASLFNLVNGILILCYQNPLVTANTIIANSTNTGTSLKTR